MSEHETPRSSASKVLVTSDILFERIRQRTGRDHQHSRPKQPFSKGKMLVDSHHGDYRGLFWDSQKYLKTNLSKLFLNSY